MKKVAIEDLLYLIEMTYGYIDDELGGMDANNHHSKTLREIMEKYGIDKEVIT